MPQVDDKQLGAAFAKLQSDPRIQKMQQQGIGWPTILQMIMAMLAALEI